MKLIITEDQFNKLPMGDNPSSSNIYERACIGANQKLNSIYQEISFITVKDLLEGKGNLGKLEDSATKYHDACNKLHRKLYNETKPSTEEEYWRNEVAIEDKRNQLDDLLRPVYDKYTLITDVIYDLQQIYYKHVEENNVDLNGIFGDIRTIDV